MGGQDLDDALRRRLEKRIYIPLPDCEGREAAFELHLADCVVSAAATLCMVWAAATVHGMGCCHRAEVSSALGNSTPAVRCSIQKQSIGVGPILPSLAHD